MIVLDLFSGSKSATLPFYNAGYEIVSVDINIDTDPTYCMDILDFYEFVKSGEFKKTYPDDICFIWASPDCKHFSIGQKLEYHWHQGNPISPQVFGALARVAATLKIIELLDPPFWVLENPRAMLRTIPMMGIYARRTVSYCQYNDTYMRMKPTDLWGFLPGSWKPKLCYPGADCHVNSGRENPSANDLIPYEERIKVPYDLPLSILTECEKVEWKRADIATLFDFTETKGRG